MTIKDLFLYCTTTPHNTNFSIFKQMVQDLMENGETEKTEENISVDDKPEEIPTDDQVDQPTEENGEIEEPVVEEEGTV